MLKRILFIYFDTVKSNFDAQKDNKEQKNPVLTLQLLTNYIFHNFNSQTA
jgi:hypothetical protein